MAGKMKPNKTQAAVEKNMDKEEERWMAEDDLRTLTRAEEIRKDRKRYDRAIKVGREKLKEMEAVIGEEDGDKD